MGRKTLPIPIAMDTRWKKIPGFDSYWVSDSGHIFHMRLQRVMAQYISNKGVRCIRLYKENHRYTKSVAKLSREAFGEN